MRHPHPRGLHTTRTPVGLTPTAPEPHPLTAHRPHVDDGPPTCDRSTPRCAKCVSPDAPETTRLAVPISAEWEFTGRGLRVQDGTDTAVRGVGSQPAGVNVGTFVSGTETVLMVAGEPPLADENRARSGTACIRGTVLLPNCSSEAGRASCRPDATHPARRDLGMCCTWLGPPS